MFECARAKMARKSWYLLHRSCWVGPGISILRTSPRMEVPLVKTTLVKTALVGEYLYSSPSSNPPKSSASRRAEPGELRPRASSMNFSCCCPPEKNKGHEIGVSEGLTWWGNIYRNTLKFETILLFQLKKYLTTLKLNLGQDCGELNLKVRWDWWELGERWVWVGWEVVEMWVRDRWEMGFEG